MHRGASATRLVVLVACTLAASTLAATLGAQPQALDRAAFVGVHVVDVEAGTVERDRTVATPADALRAATLTAARLLGVDDVRGTVAPGKDADLLLLAENPLENVSAVRGVAGVMIGRTWLDEPTLEALRLQLRKR